MSIRNRFAALTVVTLFASVILIACGSENVATATPSTFNPTAASGSGAAPAPTATQAPEATAAPQPTTAPAPSGDAAAGELAFTANGCSGCHSTGSNQVIGPGLAGLAARAGERTSLSADDYIRQSIKESGAFVVEGFAPIMPAFAQLSDTDVDNLVAYLKTLN